MMAKGDSIDGLDVRPVWRVSTTAPRILAGGHPCQGLYWTEQGTKPKVAVIAAHYNVDFTEHYMAPYFARRGIGFLGWNTRYRGFEDQFLLDQALVDIGVGTRWLREEAGVETIVVLGNSGGGSLMAAYQGEATRPSLEASGPAAEALLSLVKADLYIALNAHLGRPEVLTVLMDPSVTDENDPIATDPALDPFNPDHGPPFDEAFIARYHAAQRERNARITRWAKSELDRLAEHGFTDRLFPLFRCWADLRMIDPTIDPSDRLPNRCYRGEPRIANRGPSIGRVNFCKTWLSMWSLETSRCVGKPHLEKFDIPSLVVLGTADTGVFPSDAKTIHACIGAQDKQLEFVPGAHYFEDSTDERENVADLMVEWIRSRL